VNENRNTTKNGPEPKKKDDKAKKP
jgi:hypothetical protein